MTLKAAHDFVRGDGTRTEYLEDSRKACPSCNPDGVWADRRMAVVSRVDEAVNLECLNCGNTEVIRDEVFDHFFKV